MPVYIYTRVRVFVRMCVHLVQLVQLVPWSVSTCPYVAGRAEHMAIWWETEIQPMGCDLFGFGLCDEAFMHAAHGMPSVTSVQRVKPLRNLIRSFPFFCAPLSGFYL